MPKKWIRPQNSWIPLHFEHVVLSFNYNAFLRIMPLIFLIYQQKIQNTVLISLFLIGKMSDISFFQQWALLMVPFSEDYLRNKLKSLIWVTCRKYQNVNETNQREIGFPRCNLQLLQPTQLPQDRFHYHYSIIKLLHGLHQNSTICKN